MLRDKLLYGKNYYAIEHGINKDRLLKIAGDGADVTELLGRHARYKAHFEDYLKIAEIAVIARVGDAIPNSPMTYAGPAFFNLESISPS